MCWDANLREYMFLLKNTLGGRFCKGEFLQAFTFSPEFRKELRAERRTGRLMQVIVRKYVDIENRVWLYYSDIPWWFERDGPTRSHPEHGSETSQRRRYCTRKGVGK